MVGHSNMLLDGARYACSGVRLRMHTFSTARRCMSLAAHLALDGISSLSTSDRRSGYGVPDPISWSVLYLDIWMSRS